MTSCSLCSRPFIPGEEPASYLRASGWKDKANYPWSDRLCLWCWSDFTHWCGRNVAPTEDDLNSFIATTMAALAKRAAMGKPILKCEALCVYGAGAGDLPSHRCQHFATTQVDGHNVCGPHAWRITHGGRTVVFSEPPPPRYFIAARTSAEFLDAMRQMLPSGWVGEIAEALAPDVKPSGAWTDPGVA